MKFNDMMTPAETSTIIHRCFCCGDILDGDRKLICSGCLDPNGLVARMARMLRGKDIAPVDESGAQSRG